VHYAGAAARRPSQLSLDGLLSRHEECRRKSCGARCSYVWINSKTFFNCAVRNATSATLQESGL
jgi:hypothetical protein